MLTDLIAKYHEAQRAWGRQFEKDDDRATEQWRALMEARCAIIDFRCTTMDEVQRRAQFILSDDNLVDMLSNCSTGAAVRDFLRSMAPGARPVDKSNNGDN